MCTESKNRCESRISKHCNKRIKRSAFWTRKNLGERKKNRGEVVSRIRKVLIFRREISIGIIARENAWKQRKNKPEYNGIQEPEFSSAIFLLIFFFYHF